MNQLKQLEDILRNLRFGETADNLPELLKKEEENDAHIRIVFDGRDEV